MGKDTQQVMPVNSKAKDTFFKKVYESEERQRELISFLLGIEGRDISLANVRPVLFGNRENDFSCVCDGVIYVLTEEQSSVSPNIAYRLLEYAVAGLRAMSDSEELLYSRTRVCFPVPKLYVLQVGLEKKPSQLPECLQYDIHLSDSYLSVAEKYGVDAPKPDLEAIVHVYDFRMLLDEILAYIEDGVLPERFAAYDNSMRNYALVANGITYMQCTLMDNKCIKPKNVADVAEYLSLLLNRGVFVDLLSDKEVCDMTMAQFSRDTMLIYQGREEGREEGRLLYLVKTIYKKMLKGKTSEEISDEMEEDIVLIEQIKQAIISYKEDKE
ncbi:MAG: Rpn family recombination-promoting nuclease/putative transposase, partial [Lachnospiraceae bacterium]|nr:Rpn family recombination-promoting nuclease/putative transposase [Lachnospiraceae bacterium]